MKKYIILSIAVLIAFPVFSQEMIKLNNDHLEIENRKFYVNNVLDKRKNKKDIGEIWKGTLKKAEKLNLEGGAEKALQNYFKKNCPNTKNGQISSDVYIRFLEVREIDIKEAQIGEANIILEFCRSDGTIFIAKSSMSEKGQDVSSGHGDRIRRAINDCISQYNNKLSDVVISETNVENIMEDEVVEITFNDKPEIESEKYNERTYLSKNRNVVAVGYQIGGFNLIGFDYEIRVHDYLGVHLGAGFLGYTGGIKIHTNGRKSSMFFNISWKDGGLGQYNGVGIEAGSRWIWIRSNDFGLIFQGGLFIINYMSDEFRTTVYGTVEPPPIALSMGIGLTW